MSLSSRTWLAVMYFTKSIFVVCFMMMPVLGMSGSYQQGVDLAQSNPIPQPGGPEAVPGYAGASLPQSQINPQDLGGEALKASQANEASKLIAENFERGERFVIDPHTDPLVLAGNEIVKNPQKVLDETLVETEEEAELTEEVKTCEESGDETLETVEEIRVVTVAEPQKHYTQVGVYSHGWSGGLSRNIVTGQKYDGSTSSTPCYAAGITIYNQLPQHLHSRVKSIAVAPGSSCPAALSSNGLLSVSTSSGWGWSLVQFNTNIEIVLKPGEENIKESIVTNGHNLEERVNKGLCAYEEIQIIEGPQTRVINELPVTRDWWRRRKVYRCHYPAKNDCTVLRAKGCYQVHSTCKEKVGDVCVVWEQTYRCPSRKVSGKSYRSSNKNNPFCLSGDCADKSYVPNQDFAEVMSRLSVLKEAGDDLRNFGVIFKGLDLRCTRHCVDFKDCCGNGNGWGVSLKLASCGVEEKELAELRKKNRCVQVGTYCAEKVLGVCIRKKTTFCCYGTKLAKIIQEQGRGQLGLDFGSPEQPQCQGLTPDQLSKIDFSKINFADILSEVVGRTNPPNPEKLLFGIKKSMANKGSLLKPSIKGIKEGPLTASSGQGSHSSNEPLTSMTIPGHTLETTTKPENLQVQGRSHGQF